MDDAAIRWIQSLEGRLERLETREYSVVWDLIEESILTGSQASVGFTNIPGDFRHLAIFSQARTDRVAENDNVSIRLNADSANNYDWHSVYGFAGVSETRARATDRILTFGAEAANSRANNFAPGVAYILGYALTDRDKWVVCAPTPKFGDVSADNDMATAMNSGRWRGVGAVTEVRLIPHIGSNLVSGCRFQLYGLM
jgi:hypothetical protein